MITPSPMPGWCCRPRLAERLGIEALVDQLVDLGDRPGHHLPGRKVLTLVHAMVAGGDCIDDADVLRTGSTAAVLGHRVVAPSTLGTFLRSFTFGHVRQLDRGTEQLLGRAYRRRRPWREAGAGPGVKPMTIDVDSTICEVHGHHKDGAAYGYTRVPGYHPLLATRADTGELLHLRMRKGSANTARGAERFINELPDASAGPAQPASWCCGPTPGSGRPRSSTPASGTASGSPSPCAKPSKCCQPSPPSRLRLDRHRLPQRRRRPGRRDQAGRPGWWCAALPCRPTGHPVARLALPRLHHRP